MISTTDKAETLERAVQGRSLWMDAWRRLKRNRAAMAAIAILALMTLMAIFAQRAMCLWINWRKWHAQDLPALFCAATKIALLGKNF